MIVDAYGGRGNGEKDSEGLAMAGSREGSGKGEVVRVDRKDGGGEVEMTMGRGRQGGGNREGETEGKATWKEERGNR